MEPLQKIPSISSLDPCCVEQPPSFPPSMMNVIGRELFDAGLSGLWLLSDSQLFLNAPGGVDVADVPRFLGEIESILQDPSICNRELRLYIYSQECEPNPALMKLCQETGGGYIFKNNNQKTNCDYVFKKIKKSIPGLDPLEHNKIPISTSSLSDGSSFLTASTEPPKPAREIMAQLVAIWRPRILRKPRNPLSIHTCNSFRSWGRKVPWPFLIFFKPDRISTFLFGGI